MAEPVEVAVLEHVPGSLVSWVGWPGLDVGLAGALEQRAAVDAGADVGVHAVQRVLASSCQNSASSSGGSPPPATNVRVMSA